jgi:hypothetical protein
MDISGMAMRDLLGNFAKIRSEQDLRARQSEAFMADPSKLDSLVGKITAEISPSGQKPKLSKFSTKTDAYDSTIPEGHPFKGFGNQLKDNVAAVMQHPSAKGANPGILVSKIANQMIMEPGKSGAPILQEAFEHKRRVDASWFSSPETVRKPMGAAYDSWLAATRESETPDAVAADLRQAGKYKEAKAYLRDRSGIATPGGLALNVGLGAVGGALVAGPPGALVGAAGGAVSEVVGRPIAKAVEGTEWYKSRWGPRTVTRESASVAGLVIGTGVGGTVGFLKGGVKGGGIGAALGALSATDTGQQLLTDMAPYIATNVGIDKALAAAFLVPKAAGKAIAANPSARNILEGGKAVEEGRQLMSNDNVVGRVVNRLLDTSKYELGLNEDFVQGWKNVIHRKDAKVMKTLGDALEQHLAGTDATWKAMADPLAQYELGALAGTTSPSYAKWAKRASQNMDAQTLEDAMRHPQGFQAGFEEAISRQRARSLVEDDVYFEPRAGLVMDALTGLRASKLAKKNNAIAEKELEMANELLGKKRGKAESVVSRALTSSELPNTHDILFGGKGYIPEIENVHEVLYGGGSPTASTAAVIDSIASGQSITPSKAYTQVAKVMNSFEKDPVARSVLDTVTAPTDITGAMPSSSGATVLPTAKTLSPKWQRVKAKLEAMRDERKLARLKEEHPDLYDEVIQEEKFKAAEASLQERLGAKRAVDAEARLDADYGSSVDESVQGRAQAKSVATDKLSAASEADLAGKGELKVASAEEAAEPAVNKKVWKKAKKVTDEQAARLGAQKEVETVTSELSSRVRALDPDTATGLVSSIAKSHAAGDMTAEEALHKSETIINTITDPANLKFASEQAMYDWSAPFDSFISTLRQKVGTKTFMAAFGVPAGMVTFFAGPQGGANEAEAGGMSEAIVRGLSAVKDVGKASAELMKNMKAANYIVDSVVPETKYLLHYSEYQRGLKGTPEGGPANIISKFQEWAAGGNKSSLRYKFMSPGMIFDEVLGVGKQLMNNPAVFKASYQAAEYNNIMRAGKVIGNILRESGIESAAAEVRAMFKPLTENMSKQVEFEWRSGQIKDLTTELKRYESGSPKGLKDDVFASSKAKAEEELAMHQSKIAGLENAIPEYHAKWNAVAEEAAKKHSSVRTFLALGDNAQFEKYPFLKGIKFTPEEKVAVGRMREQLLQYKQRLKDIGEETISENYAPHIFHPDFNAREFVNTVGGDATKANIYMRIYRRSFNSRPLMPDLETSMYRYTSDTERRIQQQTFWKHEGWNDVMLKTQDIPTVYNAFKALKEGVAPVEYTNANKIAQRYMEFESVKRLFLSPSATLKHLIKVTGDLASRPISEAAEATPANIKMLGIRLAEANPRLRVSMEKLGFTAKTDQDKLIQSYFNSIVPAHGTRRMMLDLGLSPMDEVFTQAKGLWGKIQDVGGAGINFAELADRGLTVTLGRQIAAKQGMTIEQGLYGTYDMLLKNNFLSRELNPAWLNNPKIKAMMMFQGTPFKIFERRMVNFLRSSRVVKDLGEGIYDATKADIKNGNFNNTRMILKDLRDLRSTVKAGEHQLSANLFLNAALQETDFFGSTTVSTFAKDLLITGAATYGAGQLGMNLQHHFFHVPFLQTDKKEPTLNLNPGLTAIMRGYDAWKQREEGDDEFLVSKITQRWLGAGWTGTLPDPARKLLRISNNDIPEIYQDSKYKYLFAIPSIKSK